MKNKANYAILQDTPEFILIKDIGPWDKFKTVTKRCRAARRRRNNAASVPPMFRRASGGCCSEGEE